MKTIHTEILVLGSGPAGCTAAIYAARGGHKTTMVRGNQPGGQLTITTDVENYPGFAQPIKGPQLMEDMEQQAHNMGAAIVSDIIMSVDLYKRPFHLTGQDDNVYRAEALIIATGASANWLGLESEEKYRGFGVSACATCDGSFYKNRTVLVCGGGNTAAGEALYLASLAKKVYVAHRRDTLRADKVLADRLHKAPNIEVLWNTVVTEVLGKQALLNPVVTGVMLTDTETQQTRQLDVDGVFVAIGHMPNTNLFKSVLSLDRQGFIRVKPGSTKTSIVGVFAAGDVMDPHYQQAVTAAGTGCMAALDSLNFLSSL